MSQVPSHSMTQPPSSLPLHQDPAGLIVNTVSNQHQLMLQHLTNLINERFATTNSTQETIIKHQMTFSNSHQRILASVEDLTNHSESHDKTLAQIDERIYCLERSLLAVSKNIDQLARGVRKIHDKVDPLTEATRDVEIAVKKINEKLKDTKALATSSRTIQNGVIDTTGLSDKLIRIQDRDKLIGSMDGGGTNLVGKQVRPLRPMETDPLALQMDTLQTFSSENPYGPVIGPEGGSLSISRAPARPVAHNIHEPATDRHVLGLETPSKNNQSLSFDPSPAPETCHDQRRKGDPAHSPSPLCGDNIPRHLPDFSHLFDTDLSDLTDLDSEMSEGEITNSSIGTSSFKKRDSRRQGLHHGKYHGKVKGAPKYTNRRANKTLLGTPWTSGWASIQRKMNETIRMICCDECDRWYHNPCVSLTSEDLDKMSIDVPFICPACIPERKLDFVKPYKQGSACSALQCVVPSDPREQGVYFIGALLGRKPCPHIPSQFSWLVQFEGYTIEHCLWKPESTFPAAPLVSEFYLSAKREGLQLDYLHSNESQSETFLLAEAKGYCGTWEDNDA